MATDNVTPMCAGTGNTLPYYGYLASPFDEVRVTVNALGDDSIEIEYRALPQDLIAAGVATAAQLQPGRGGVRRVDTDGDSFYLRRARGVPRMAIFRRKALGNAATMPGVEAWMIEAVKAEQAENAAAYNAQMATSAQEELAPDLWRARRLGTIYGVVCSLRNLCGPDGVGFGKLEDGYRVNPEDAEAFVACVVKAENQLTAIMQRLRIEHTAAGPTRGLRLVVDNARSEARS